MDARKAYLLDKIGRSIPKELLRRGLDTVKGSSQMQELVEHVARKSGDKRLQKLVKEGHFIEKDSQVVNKQADKEIQAWVDTKVAQEMKRGNLKPATKEELREWNPSQES